MKARIDALQHAARSLGKPITNGGQRLSLVECVWAGLNAPADKELEDLQGIQMILHQVFLATYREAKKHDPDAALWLLRSYMEDHPTVPGSNLFSKLVAMLEASLAVQQNAPTIDSPERGNRNTTFLVTREAYRAGAEFIPALMGWLSPIVQVMNGDAPQWTTLKQPAATKIQTFERISSGEDGIFYILFRIINKDLRNAIAHSDVQLDADAGEVVYRVTSGGALIEKRMPNLEFMFGVLMFSHLPSMYLSALAAIFLLEFGRPEDKLKLPTLSVEAFSGVKIR